MHDFFKDALDSAGVPGRDSVGSPTEREDAEEIVDSRKKVLTKLGLTSESETLGVWIEKYDEQKGIRKANLWLFSRRFIFRLSPLGDVDECTVGVFDLSRVAVAGVEAKTYRGGWVSLTITLQSPTEPKERRLVAEGGNCRQLAEMVARFVQA